MEMKLSTVHLAPEAGQRLTRCCGVPVEDIPAGEFIAYHEAAQTCRVTVSSSWAERIQARLVQLETKVYHSQANADEVEEYKELSDISLRLVVSREAEKQETQSELRESQRMLEALRLQMRQLTLQLQEMTRVKDEAYLERAKLLAWRVASAITQHNPIEPWDVVMAPATDVTEPGWWLLFMKTPMGQLSWHLSPDQVKLFDFVTRVEPEDPRAQWDGHTTPEKYGRIQGLIWQLVYTNPGVQNG